MRMSSRVLEEQGIGVALLQFMAALFGSQVPMYSKRTVHMIHLGNMCRWRSMIAMQPTMWVDLDASMLVLHPCCFVERELLLSPLPELPCLEPAGTQCTHVFKTALKQGETNMTLVLQSRHIFLFLVVGCVQYRRILPCHGTL